MYNSRSADNVATFYSRTNLYNYSFIPYTILEWNKQDKNIQQSKTVNSFRNSLQNLFIIYIYPY